MYQFFNKTKYSEISLLLQQNIYIQDINILLDGFGFNSFLV